MDIIKEIKKNYTNLNTISTKITQNLSELKKLGVLDKKQTKTQKILREQLFKIKLDIAEENKQKPFDKNLQLENLRNIWLAAKVEDKYKLITGLYIWIPALRTDYINGEINVAKNQIVIKNFVKINTEDGTIIDIPPELIPIISSFELLNLTSRNTFIQQLRFASNIIFGKKLSIDIFRRSWVEFGARTMKQNEIANLAKKMNHSLAIHNTTYMPKQNIEYK